MDWEACIICGDNYGKLKCPSKTLQGNGLSIYEDFINNVNDFKEIDLLPVTVKIDDDTNAHNLFDNNAKWHKSCHLNFATSKLLKIKKRKYNAEAESKIRKSTRLSYGTVYQAKLHVYFVRVLQAHYMIVPQCHSNLI